MKIVCGPIVRHTTRQELNVWLVLNEQPESVSIAAFADMEQSESVAISTHDHILRLAQSCYVVMLTAQITLAPSCERVFYDIKVNNISFAEDNFRASICYAEQLLPSVVIPQKHQNFAQISCRKPHAKGPRDQIAALDQILESSLNTSNRPSQLYMTGDQIYADDVSPILLEYIDQMRQQLGFVNELVTLDSGQVLNPYLEPLDGRKSYANESTGFTSGEGSSQLTTFAEYLCMYIFAFSGQLSEPTIKFKDYEDLKDKLLKKRFSHSYRHRNRFKYQYSKKQYKKELKQLSQFANTCQTAARRALANISSYMIFDDHEVTDDWNLNEENFHKLQNTSVGSQIYTNALAAYTVCQHWGNVPLAVGNDLEKISMLCQDFSNENRKLLKHLQSNDWGYLLDQQPPALVLDTRTDRMFHGYKKSSLALMSPKRIKTVGKALSQLEPSETLLLISPAPMYGFTGVERLQLNFRKFDRLADREPWAADEFALRSLQLSLTELTNVQNVAIFSGDVHYGFSRRFISENNESEPMQYWQLCSSASNNSPVGDEIGIGIVDWYGKFDNYETEYLRPENDNQDFLTSDKNIGTLHLDENLRPVQATLHCIDEDNDEYEKVYNLIEVRVIND